MGRPIIAWERQAVEPRGRRNSKSSCCGHEVFPPSLARIIFNDGAQFIAHNFKEFIRLSGMTHASISRFYPQSNGKIER